MNTTRRLAMACIVTAPLVAFLGCRPALDRLPCYPVNGTITLKGTPLANALIAFHPVDTSNPLATTARATSDASGNFSLSTYDALDGAPEGEYRVTVTCYKPIGSGSSLEPGPNILPNKYARPDSTDIRIRVAKGENASQKIDIK